MSRASELPPLRVALAILVHVFTASGLITGFIAATAVIDGDLSTAFYAMFASVVIDAIDGTFARAVDVHRYSPWINGRKLDDIVDFVNYTLVPVLLVWKADWVPEPAWLWCAFPLLGSVFAFVHEGAKEEDRGFFRGFPSYWNVVVFYLALFVTSETRWIVLPILVGLGILSVAPIRFVYPNRPPCWKPFFLGGAIVWGGSLLVLLAHYPEIPDRWIILSGIYPVLYAITSVYLDRRDRQQTIFAAESLEVEWPVAIEPASEGSTSD